MIKKTPFVNILPLVLMQLLIWTTGKSQNITDTLCSEAQTKPEKLTCMLQYCREHFVQDSNYSFTVFNHVLSEIKKAKIYPLMDDYNYTLGHYFFTNDINDSALLYFNRVSSSSDNFNLYREKAILFNRIGQIDKAKQTIEIALDIAKKNNNKQQIANAYRAYGIFYKSEGLYAKALRTYQQSLLLYQEINDPKGQASIYNNISTIYTRTENYPLSIEYLIKAYKLYKVIPYYQGVAGTLTNIGVVYECTGNYDKALNYLSQAEKIYQDLGFKRYLGMINNNLGVVSQKKGDYKTSQTYFEKALKTRQEINDKAGEASVLQNMGVLLCEQKQFNKATEYLTQSLTIIENIRAHDKAPSILDDLSECWAKRGDHKMAYKYMKELRELNDKLLNEKRIEQLTQMENRFQTQQAERKNIHLEYENELKEKTIRIQRQVVTFSLAGLFLLTILVLIVFRWNRLLKIKNKEISWKQDRIINQNELLESQKKQLQQLNKAKDQYFTIATQNLWEPVGTIRNLLEHMLQIHGKAPNNNFESFIKTSKEAAVLTFNLLENLLYWARIQQGQIEYEPEPHYLKPIIAEALKLQQPRATSKLVVTRMDIDDAVQGYFDEELMKTVFRNLIENAIKFSTRGGEVTVKAFQYNGKTNISISDTGVGMTKDQLLQLFNGRDVFSTLGTHGEKGGGLGLIISKAFVERNFGTITAKSYIAEGTTITIALPSSREALVQNNH